MLKDQYTFTRAFSKSNFIYELTISKGKKEISFDLAHLMDLDTLNGNGTSLYTVLKECKKAGLVSEKTELAFIKAYFKFVDYGK